MDLNFGTLNMEKPQKVCLFLFINDTNRLEQIQLNAARMVTGLPFFASSRSLYFETGWENLADRRQIRKLTLMYKIVNGDAPSYLIDLGQID